jgi:3-phosphoshikimate 1-carboxyvinyltransferase
MMNRILISAPQRIETDILLPASKSICNRVLVMHALAGGQEKLSNLSDCDDTRVMVEALRDRPRTINIGAAGTAMRFLTAYLSTQPETHILTGTERMQHRPIQILVDALRCLGADITYSAHEGFPPLSICGTSSLKGGEVVMSGGVSSQYISAVLLIAPTLHEGLTLHLTDKVISRSYINMTMQLMREFGVEADWQGDDTIIVKPSRYQDIPYSVESDWSAASYWYEMTALSTEAHVKLTHLRCDSYQGDSRVASVFEKLGVHTAFKSDGVYLMKTNDVVSRFEDDFADIPDLAQTVVTTCALLGMPFRITGLQTLKIKETDRIVALENELRKLGYVLHDEDGGNVMYWNGECCQPSANPIIATYEDHRMAMAFAPAALKFEHISIEHPEVVNKSYVGYWKDLQQAGFVINEI